MNRITLRARTSSPADGIGRAAVLGILVVAILAIGASSASAIIVHLPNGSTLSYQPVPGASSAAGVKQFSGPPLEYHGGPVMSSNTNYVIYWDPKKAPKYAPGYTKGVQKYFQDLAHDSGGIANTDSVLVQYGAAYKSAFGKALKDKDPYPPSGCAEAPICLTDEQLRTEIAHVVESRGLPTDLTHEYFLLTPEGVESCFEATGGVCSANSSSPAYCAYHGDIPVGGGVIVYSNDPYVYLKNCDEPSHHPTGKSSDSALLGGLPHEHSESLTDPELNAWFDETGSEIGDKCRTFEPESEWGPFLGTAPDGSPYNQVIHKHLYFYQQEYSNEGLVCKQHV